MRYTSDYGYAIFSLDNVLDGISLVYNSAAFMNPITYPSGSTPSGPPPGMLGGGWVLSSSWRFFANVVAYTVSGVTSLQSNDGLGSFQVFTLSSSNYITNFGDNYVGAAAVTVGGTAYYTLTSQDLTVMWFLQSNGQLNKIVDRYGNTLTFTYSSGVLQSVSDGQGRGYYFIYGPNGLPSSIRSQNATGGLQLQIQYTTSTPYLVRSKTRRRRINRKPPWPHQQWVL